MQKPPFKRIYEKALTVAMSRNASFMAISSHDSEVIS
jgi:hypothetical protein